MTILDDKKQVAVTSIADWRLWLEQHHEQDEGVWVVTFKKHCGDWYVAYEELVEEALCFGWVDSHNRKVDEDRTQLYISPRRKGSPWSASNKKRVQKLLREKRMQKPGQLKIDAAKKDGSWSVYDDIEKGLVPSDLKHALDKNVKARKHWGGFPKQVRKNILWWIKQAKKAETRQNRIEKTVSDAAQGRMANHPG